MVHPVDVAAYLRLDDQDSARKPEDVDYAAPGAPLFELFRKAKIRNEAQLRDRFPEQNSLVSALEDTYRIACCHLLVIWREPYATVSPVQDVLFPCFHKSLLSLCTSHDLTMAGLWGPARPHLRHAFESLMIAKLSATDPLSDVFDRWIDGVDLYFTNAVLKKIRYPPTDEFRNAWSLLSTWSHATVYAMQPTLELTEAERQVTVNFALTAVLIQCAHHLLNSHIITKSVRYYADRYGAPEDAETARRLRLTFTRQNASLSSPARRLIRDFRSSWKL